MLKDKKILLFENKGNVLISLLIKAVILIAIIAISIHIGKRLGKKENASIANQGILENRAGLDLTIDKQTQIVLDKTNATPIAELIGQFIENENKKAIDQYGNLVVIPEGFRIVPNGQNNVEYGWYTEETSNPSVQEGIVIEDIEGNQFVWVPVGKINNKEGDTTRIALARYVFDANYDYETNTTYGTGEIIDITTNQSVMLEDIFTEDDEETHNNKLFPNKIAKDIYTFVETVPEKGGYYLARYEASLGEDGKINSKSAPVWGEMRQFDASKSSQAMYENKNFTSDLTNSYAWDTAIAFIQTYSGDSDYSKERAKSFQNNFVNTGTTNDKRCNIYDMASNYGEWTTETAFGLDASCTYRGGAYKSDHMYTSSRGISKSTSEYMNISFRPILYIN